MRAALGASDLPGSDGEDTARGGDLAGGGGGGGDGDGRTETDADVDAK
jgi:hypothetical protein